MNELRPDEAADALARIVGRQEQVIKHVIVPRWYWWTIAALMVGFAAAVDSRVPEVIAVATIVFVVAVVNITGSLVRATLRRAQPRDELLGPLGVLAILGFVAVIVGVSLPISFALQAAAVPYPATWVSWPVLSSWSPASHCLRGC
jgi:uncharacterized membrane protein YgdD (TMEM256/DUF423 family)